MLIIRYRPNGTLILILTYYIEEVNNDSDMISPSLVSLI